MRRFQHLETVVGMNLLKGGSLPQFGRGIAENALVSGAVIKAASFDVDQGNHVGGVFSDDLKQLFAFFRLPANPIDEELLQGQKRGQCAESDPIPVCSHCVQKNVFKEDIGKCGKNA